MVTIDRILLIDLKDWRGKIRSQDGNWYQNGRDMGRSPVAKISENTRDVHALLSTHLQNESRRLNVKLGVSPRIQGLVVLTGTNDVSDIAPTEAAQVWTISDFLKTIINTKDRVSRMGAVPPIFVSNQLTSPDWRSKLTRFFNVQNGPFRPGTRRYGSYRATSDDPSFQHRTQVFEEFDVQDEQAAQATGILRRWDFSKADTRFQTEEGRSEIAGRERVVVAWLNDRNAECESILLQPKVDDPEKGVGYWEIFERRRRLERLRDFVRSETSRLSREDRLELTRQIIVKVKILHDLDVSHLDLGIHSVWMESPSVVRLSHLMAASYPEIQTLGENRFQFLSSVVSPEQVLGITDSQKKKDVFMLGCVSHYLLFGKLPNMRNEDDPPEWDSNCDRDGVYMELHPWFAQALALDPAERFPNATAMLEAFNRALPRNTSSKEVLEGLDKFRTLKSQIDLILKYTPIKRIRDNDRLSIWTSTSDDVNVLVKMWKRQAWGDQNKEASRLLDFLERAENFIQTPIPGCARILDAYWMGDAFALVQEYIEAPCLSEMIDLGNSWPDRANVLGFLNALTEMVVDLHDRGIAHGDLKPQNILVITNEQWVPLLIDTLDFASEADGELRTTAYSPEAGGRFERDRHSVTKIIEDFIGAGLVDNDSASSFKEAIEKIRVGPPPNATLLPLLEVIQSAISPKDIEVNYDLSLSIFGAAVGSVVSDEGRFWIRVAPDKPKLFIRGAQEEIEIIFDQDSNPVAGRRRILEQKRIRTLTKYEFASFSGEVNIISNEMNRLSDLEKLLQIPDVSDACKVMSGLADSAGPDVDEHDVDESLIELNSEEYFDPLTIEEGENPTGFCVDVQQLWRSLIDFESELTTEGVALGDSSYRRDRKRHVLPFKLETGTFDFDRDDKVMVERIERDGRIRKIGYLDLSSNPEHILIEAFDSLHSRDSGPLVIGDQRLRFQSHFEATSRTRRHAATQRIISGRSVLPNLIDVFDPRKSYLPVQASINCDAKEIKKRYNLNDVQAQALVDVLMCRPVGLLQGPPGTGKTRFIGALVHFALTQGLVKNVLLASQSHEAVNNAAEAVLQLFDAQETLPNILRVGHEGVVSDRLLSYHVSRVEALFKDKFRAEFRERLRLAGNALGLDSKLITQISDLEIIVFQVVEKFRFASSESEGDDQEKVSGIVSTLKDLASRLGLVIDGEVEAERDIVQELVDQVAARYPLESRDRISRLRHTAQIARDFIGSVSTRQRSFESFLAGTRQIVAGTCVGLGRSSLGLTSIPFDLVVVDEAPRCTASELAVPIQAGRWIVLVGDQAQLEPLHHEGVINNVSRETKIPISEIKKSDFARVFESTYGKNVGRVLTEQYRMLPAIGEVVNVFYGGILTHGRDVPEIDVSALPDELVNPVVWVSTDSLGISAQQQFEKPSSKSLINPCEASIIVEILRKLDAHEPFKEWLLNQNCYTKPIGIICTYADQGSLIRKKIQVAGLSDALIRAINVDTVDSYQGKENTIIFLSLVRNNYEGESENGSATIRQGFMVAPNRLNVALSRAKDRLVIVGARSRWPSSGPMSLICESFSQQLAIGKASLIDATEFISTKQSEVKKQFVADLVSNPIKGDAQ